jgi:hypothetical protein
MNKMNRMPEKPPKFETPLPGQPVAEAEAQDIIVRFEKRFRVFGPSELPSNVPTACILGGRKVGSDFISEKLLNNSSIYFYIESAALLHSAEPQTVQAYLAKKEPWEDYDICLFDKSLDWCLGATHNDELFLADPKAIFG